MKVTLRQRVRQWAEGRRLKLLLVAPENIARNL
jgi:hypothetical protein